MGSSARVMVSRPFTTGAVVVTWTPREAPDSAADGSSSGTPAVDARGDEQAGQHRDSQGEGRPAGRAHGSVIGSPAGWWRDSYAAPRGRPARSALPAPDTRQGGPACGTALPRTSYRNVVRTRFEVPAALLMSVPVPV